jgi:hypothetical protein
MENTKDISTTTNNPITLTVVVQDDKSQPTAGAKVSIKPSDASSVTNTAGEVQFKLGNDTKYEITATYSNKKVTVPYYVTKDGATRLVVNPTYVRTIEKQLHPSIFSSKIFVYAGIIVGIILLFFIFRRLSKLLRRKRRKVSRESKTTPPQE